MNRRKEHLPEKTCPVCGLPFTWRRRWKANWPSVRYCSERCRRSRGRAVHSLALVWIAVSLAGFAAPAKAQLTVDLDAYLGYWFELARTPNDFQDNRPRRDGTEYSVCHGSTAHYARTAPDSVRIVNRCERFAADGTRYQDEATGYALARSGSGGAVFRIAFGPAWARWLQRIISLGGFEYRIFALGPKNARGEYSWSLVSNSDRDFLFVLAREPGMNDVTWQQVMQTARNEGLPVDRLVRRPARPAEQ